ncbi:uncharacterized protein LOC126194873 isoform X2 [Schistocerca nitens]|uniref:uncharacterized protein LOC126194873 isoform X2 n=1 Tax=Schistocerca nitens TaxID=7011 RepID=UPI00211819E9|nr:uncharacterized protein LOC126194873 isoform X2 [Schistocerca nitens]
MLRPSPPPPPPPPPPLPLLLLAVFVLLISLEHHLAAACPSACKCMWKGGKQTVECIGEGLITIPDGIDPGTQVLEFSGNNLQSLPRERFQRMGIINLQRIYLARCRIVQIDDRAFKGLTNLVELDLSQNQLRYVPTATFSDYPSLMRLIMNGNPIRSLEAGAFKSLPFLTTLELSDCEIETVEPGAFSGLDNLEWLKLDGNRLNNIRGTDTLPSTLHEIYLHQNPWQCDCRLTDLRAWLVTYKVPHTEEPKCTSPVRLKGELIKTLDLNDLACLPDVSPTTLYLEIAEGKNVSLLCRVSAIPEARVSWWFQGRILQNDSLVAPGVHLYYFVEEGSEEKKSELFIFNTNTEDNGTFVCVAENPAGKSHSNYTIRIIVREEPIVGPPPFPYEYVITIACSISVIVLFLLIGVVACAIRCRRRRMRRRKKERSKVVALQQGKGAPLNPITRLGGGAGGLGGARAPEGAAGMVPPPAKANGALLMGAGADGRSHALPPLQHDVMMSLAAAGGGSAGAANPCLAGSPHSMRSYALEANPDLINDTESIGKERHRGDGDGGEEAGGESGSYQEAMENVVPLHPLRHHQLPHGHGHPHQHHTADVHPSPGALDPYHDPDGYPLDFGLPRVPPPPPHAAAVPPPHHPFMYRTLPHSRSVGAATPSARFSREAEFLARTAYDLHYSPPDVRYTLEGYPAPAPTLPPFPGPAQDTAGSYQDAPYLPSPPAPYKGETTHCVGSQTNGELPNGATLSPTVSPSVPDEAGVAVPPPVATSSSTAVGDASTNTGGGAGAKPPLQRAATAAQCLTESPDEGYVGDGADGSDM